MRIRILAAASVLLAACAGSEPPPTLSISPSGSQNVTGPVLITASPIALANEVTWSLSGPGTLSNTTGHDVTYRPPVPASSSPATVTATARGQTATVVFTGQTPQQPKAVIPGLAADVNVTYDQFDIPHIFCASDTDCFAVQGYIQAQDRLFQMDLFRRTAEGRLAELVGAVEAGQDEQFLTLFITRDLQRIEDKLYASLAPDIKAKIDAFTGGRERLPRLPRRASDADAAGVRAASRPGHAGRHPRLARGGHAGHRPAAAVPALRDHREGDGVRALRADVRPGRRTPGLDPLQPVRAARHSR